MAKTSNVSRRIEELNADLGTMIVHYQRLARWNYWTAFGIRFATVLSSVVAGIGGLSEMYPKVFAVVAFLPAALAVFAANLKFQDRAHWHYRKKDAINRLRNRLRFELPDPPTRDAVAEISSDLSALNISMSAEWEALFGLDTQVVAKPGPVNSTG